MENKVPSPSTPSPLCAEFDEWLPRLALGARVMPTDSEQWKVSLNDFFDALDTLEVKLCEVLLTAGHGSNATYIGQKLQHFAAESLRVMPRISTFVDVANGMTE